MVPHTIVVDFAVALLITSVVCDLLSAVSRDRELAVVATWTLLFGTLAAGFAVLSGYVAARAATADEAVLAEVTVHRNLGIATFAFFLTSAAWRLANGGETPRRGRIVYRVISIVGLLLVATTAYWGGHLVFSLGVGVTTSR